MVQSQFSNAVQEFKKVLQLEPTLVEAKVNLGLAYQSLDQYQLAVEQLSAALRQRPNLLAPNVIVGIDYLRLGAPQKSLPYLERAAKLNPANPEVHQALASTYLAQENFRGAGEEFRQLAALDTDKSEAWFKLGHEYLDLAARLAYTGARLYPNSAWGHRFLGDLLFQRNRWDDAVKEYRKALTIDPKQPGLHTSVAEALLHGGHLDDAAAEFHLELQLGSANELTWLGLAELALSQGQPQTGLEDVAQAWDISPEVLALQREFPTIEITRNVAQDSITGLQASAESPAKNFLLAALFSAAGDNANAIQQWKAFQSDVVTWQKMDYAKATSQAACRENHYSACERWLESLKGPTQAQRLLLGKTQVELRGYESAADALAELRGTPAENAEASYWLARTYQSLGAQAYAQLEESYPDSWRMHQLRGEGAAARKDYTEAAKQFQMALQIHPASPDLHEALGELYLDTHSDADAQSELEKAIALDGSRPHALYLLGRLYVQSHDDSKAIPYLQKALHLQPDLSQASSLLGTAFMRMGRFTDALPNLQTAAPHDHYGNVHYQLYLAYKKLGKEQLAQRALSRSQDLRRSSLEHDQALIMGAPQADNETQ